MARTGQDRQSSVEAIRRIVLEYPRASDSGDLAAVGVFESNVKMGAVIGQLETDIPEGELHSAPAEEAAEAYGRNVTFYPDGLSHAKHLITNLDIKIAPDGQTAEARSFFIVLQASEGFPLQFIITGRYLDGFALEDGAWQLKTRREFIDQIGDLSHHLSPEILAQVF